MKYGTDKLLVSVEMSDNQENNKENVLDASSLRGPENGNSWKAYLCGCASVLGVTSPPTLPVTPTAPLEILVPRGDTYPSGLSKDFWVDKNPVVVVRVPHKTLCTPKKTEPKRHIGHAHALGRGHC